MKKFGFTLAEILITLGIIGVVTSVTMPTLINSHQKTVYVTQLKKATLELSSVLERYMSDQRIDSIVFNRLWGDATFFRKYFNVLKTCSGSNNPCFTETYKTLKNEIYTPGYYTINSICANGAVLSSGAIICILPGSQFFIDVNGNKGPNIAGRDFFMVSFDGNGRMYGSNSPINNHNTFDTRYFQKIVDDGWKMNY